MDPTFLVAQGGRALAGAVPAVCPACVEPVQIVAGLLYSGNATLTDLSRERGRFQLGGADG